MESGLIRSKKNSFPKRCLLILFVISTFLFIGCDLRSGYYPFEKSEKWYCKDPEISLCYTKKTDGNWEFSETLIWMDEVIEISIGMRSNLYCVYPANSAHYDDRLFQGEWGYRGGKLVLTIEEDLIFEGKYSEIILSPVT